MENVVSVCVLCGQPKYTSECICEVLADEAQAINGCSNYLDVIEGREISDQDVASHEVSENLEQ